MEEGNRRCGRRKCAHKNTNASSSPTGICCWRNESSLYNRDSAEDEGLLCGCTPSGLAHDARLATSADDCCSGEYSDADLRVCGCLADHSVAYSEDQRSSCCSGETIDVGEYTYCKAENCTLPGHSLAAAGNGSHCCVETDQLVAGICPCKPGGEEALHPSYCCTETLDDNGKCTWFGGDRDLPDWMPESACYSGEFKNAEGRTCHCLEHSAEKLPGLTPVFTPEQFCCSESYVHEGANINQCSCLRVGQHSSSADHCCSKRMDNSGHCACALPGSPVRTEIGMDSEQCCSARAADGFCQCQVTGGDAPGCCGSVSAGGKCECIPGHHQLPSTEVAHPDSVCCHTTANCSDVCSTR